MWAEVSFFSASSSNQHYYISIELDSYFMIDLVSISFIKFLDIFFCMRKKYQHIILNLEDMSEINSIVYKIHYLKLCIADQWNHLLEFIQLFVIVDCNAQDSQILLDRSVLKNFKINIYNDINSWKFEQKFQMTEIFLSEFIKKLTSITYVFEVWTAYRSCLDNDNNDKSDFWNNENNISDDLTNMLKKLC